MAACGGIEHIFDKTLPESHLLQPLSSPWKEIECMKSVDHCSFSEIFGFLKESNHHYNHSVGSLSFSSSFSSPSSSLSSYSFFSPNPSAPLSPFDNKKDENGIYSIYEDKSGSPKSSYHQRKQYRHSESFSSKTSESLSICTEGLGFESFDDVEDLLRTDIFCNNYNCDNLQADHDEEEEEIAAVPVVAEKMENNNDDNINVENNLGDISKKSRLIRTSTFPPPITSIGRSGKPCVSFKSFRQDGRFILKEIRIPNKELLHAYREDGRLKLQFIQSDDEEKEPNFLDDANEENYEDASENDDVDETSSMEMEEEM